MHTKLNKNIRTTKTGNWVQQNITKTKKVFNLVGSFSLIFTLLTCEHQSIYFFKHRKPALYNVEGTETSSALSR